MGNWYNDDSPAYCAPPPLARRTRPSGKEERAAYCVGCGLKLETGFKGCPACGREAAKIRRSANGAEETCGQCRTKLRPEFVFCPGCREKLLPMEHLGAACACGTMLAPGHAHCGGCGAPNAT